MLLRHADRSHRRQRRLAAEPALVNSDAAGKAWFFKLKISDKRELDGLMDEAAYAKHTA